MGKMGYENNPKKLNYQSYFGVKIQQKLPKLKMAVRLMKNRREKIAGPEEPRESQIRRCS